MPPDPDVPKGVPGKSHDFLGNVDGVVLEPLPNGIFRVELKNGVKVLAHVADRLATRFARLKAGDRVTVELAENDRSRGRIREIKR